MVPGLIAASDGIERDEHFAHDGGESDFAGSVVAVDEPLTPAGPRCPRSPRPIHVSECPSVSHSTKSGASPCNPRLGPAVEGRVDGREMPGHDIWGTGNLALLSPALLRAKRQRCPALGATTGARTPTRMEPPVRVCSLFRRASTRKDRAPLLGTPQSLNSAP